MKRIIKYYNNRMFILFLIGVFAFSYFYLLYSSTYTYGKKLESNPEYSTMELTLTDDEESNIKTVEEYYKSKDEVSSITIIKETYYGMATDVERKGIIDENIVFLIYDERYEEFVEGPGYEELGANEIIIPKYYMPGDASLYNENGYIDGDTLVGKEINYILKEFSDSPIQMKVVGTYNNIKCCNITGNSPLVNEKSLKAWYLMNNKNTEENYNKCDTKFIVKYNDFEPMQFMFASNKQDLPKGYEAGNEEGNRVSVGSGYLSSDIQSEISITASMADNYKKLTMVSGIITLLILIIYVVLGIKNKKVVNQIAKCFFSMLIAYVVSILSMIYFIVSRNKEIQELDIFDIGRNYTFQFNSVNFIIGISLLALFVLFFVIDILLNAKRRED